MPYGNYWIAEMIARELVPGTNQLLSLAAGQS